MIMSSCSLKWRPATKCSWHTNINQSIQYCDIWRNFHPLHEENSKNEEGKPHLFLALVLVSLAGLPWGCGPTIKRNQKQIQTIIWWWDEQACLTNSCLVLLCDFLCKLASLSLVLWKVYCAPLHPHVPPLCPATDWVFRLGCWVGKRWVCKALCIVQWNLYNLSYINGK